MCQVNGPSAYIGCSKCGGGYYEGSQHTCKVFVSFEDWLKDLKRRAKKQTKSDNHFIESLNDAVRRVATWPRWKLEWMWSEEFRYSVGKPDSSSKKSS